ncbi:MAG: YHS domain-containing protein [Syntrophales bacterium]
MKTTDPVCKMVIEEEDAAATTSYKGKTYRFCSSHCKQSFDSSPESYLGAASDDGKKENTAIKVKAGWTCPMHPEIINDAPGNCPKCGMDLAPKTASVAEEESNAEYEDKRKWPSQDRISNRNPGPYPFIIGIAAALGVVGFYFSLLTLTSDWNNAKMLFGEYRWWIIALSLGLGIQAALFSYLRRQLRLAHMRGAKTSLAASGGVSTAAMAACCAHYLVPLVPALGLPFLSATVAGIAEYQSVFFFLGVLSNLFGIGFMLRLMSRNGIIKIRYRRQFKGGEK